MLNRLDLLSHWITVVVYAAVTVLFIYGVIFNKDIWIKRSKDFTIVGVMVHTFALGIRWAAVGHGPFYTRYELLSSYVLIAMLMYLVLVHKYPRLISAGVLVYPVSLLIMGVALTSYKNAIGVAPAFNYIWIVLHVLFAQMSYGAALIGSALALLYLLKKKEVDRGRLTEWYKKLPSLEEMDILSYKFHGFAFLTIGIMLGSGSIWANYAWGRYWSWDPIEVWSLISWLLYGIYLHLRKIHGWAGARAAWASFVALVVLIFILVGVGWVYNSLHSPYFL